jgi:curved DNA-binding protein CbpA
MSPRDHYATLGIPRNADAKRIRDAYRRLARMHHPDLHPGDQAAEDALKQINEAYEVLSNPEKRRKYNLLGADWKAVLEDDDTLRHASGFGPVVGAGAAPRSSRRATVEHVDYAAFAKSVPLLLFGLAAISLGVITSSGWGGRQGGGTGNERAVEQWRKATAGIADLRLGLYGFAQMLDEGVDAWGQVCAQRGMETDAFLNGTVKPNYERRYRESAQMLIGQITRSEAVGLSAFPLPSGDQEVLRSLLSLRDQLLDDLHTESILDCRNDAPLAKFRRLAHLARVSQHCLDRLSSLDPGYVCTQAKAGRNICGTVPNPNPR